VEDFTSTSHFPIPPGFLNSFTDLPAIGLYPGDILPGVTYSTNVDSNSSSSNEFNIDGGGGGFAGGFLDSLNLGSSRPLTVTSVSPVQGFGFDTNGALGGTTQIVQIGDVSFTLSLPDSDTEFFLDSSAMPGISAAPRSRTMELRTGMFTASRSITSLSRKRLARPLPRPVSSRCCLLA
jgi:hypothetical protein